MTLAAAVGIASAIVGGLLVFVIGGLFALARGERRHV